MAQVINTNVASLNAQRQMYKSQSAQQTAMERLSSGLRINSARDDAAGLAIADRMTSQVKGLNQAMRNANDGISVAQTAEGAMGEISNSLQRMRELAVQAANDTNTASDRVSIQKEVGQLQQEITRVAQQTQFNGKNLLDGTFTNQSFQIGAYSGQTMSFSIGNVQASNIGNHAVTSDGTLSAAKAGAANNFAAQTLTVSGSAGSASTAVLGAGSSAYAVATAVNGLTSQTGVTASATTTATLDTLSAAGTVTFNLTGSGTAAISANVASTADLQSLADAINGKTAATGITAAATGGSLQLTSADGHDIKIDTFAGSAAGNQTVNMTGGSGAAVALTEGGANAGTVGGTVSFSDASDFSVITDVATTLMSGASTASTLSAVGSIDVGAVGGSQNAINSIDGALKYVDNLRATLGAVQNRFGSAISNMQTTSENVSAARSRIQDTDFAATTSELSRTQVLQQAGTAMLAQANAATQNVLSLLR